MHTSSYQLVLGALCAGQVIFAEGIQKPLPAGSKEGKSPFTDEFGKHVDRLLEKWHVPGMAIGVVDKDNIWTEVRLTDLIYSGGLIQDSSNGAGFDPSC